ncbi:MAG: translation initiation factor IF-2 [Bacteroidetes bacterium QS_7_67_15]|nr:MAG: translation initiation factor IF-2 [Bacteroidetes bacterium QS_7_67_15]
MPTTKEKTKGFKPVRLFKVTKELNVVTDKIVTFLEENGYEDDFTGESVTDRVTSEEAYLALKEEFASDAEAAERLAELRATQDEEEPTDRDEVASIGADEEEDALQEEAPAADEEPSAAEEEEAQTREAQADGAPHGKEESEAQPEAAAKQQEAPADEASLEKEPTAEASAEEKASTEEKEAAEDQQTQEAAEATAAAAAEDDSDEMAAHGEAETAPSEPADDSASEAEAEGAPSVEATGEHAAASEETGETAPAEEEVEATADEAATEATEAETTAEADADSADDPEAEAPTTSAEGETPGEAAEGEAAAEGKTAAKGGDEVLRGDRHKLKGASVVGKVDLSKFKRRKRKRKEKKKEKKKARQRSRDKGKKKGGGKKKKKKKKNRGGGPEEEDIEERLQETLRELEQNASRERQRRRQRRRERHAAEREAERQRRKERENILRVTEYVSTGELANLMDEQVNDVISTLFEAGLMVSINQRLDAETIDLVASEYGYEVEFTGDFAGMQDIEVEEDEEEDLVPRAPVVTVMGHVDHGKTSLLDFVRKENVVGGETGGITQHIGAYKVRIDSNDELTFLDTPGHEAFTAMRARGARATDVVVLVVAADDAVMPQTREAINHAQAADVPIVVAINKMDLPEADEQRVMQQLAEENVLVEQYGGEVQCALVSAETGEGIDDLLEKVVLESELHELRANPERVGSGVVIESHLEKGRGNVVTALIKNGTLRIGDAFVAGIHSGRVRAMFNEKDQRIEKVGPSEPALILGSNGGPEVGDQFVVFEDESEARDVAQQRQQIHREQRLRQKSHITLDEIGRRLALGEFHELNLVIKGDVSGSVEALSDALLELRTEEVTVNVVHSGAGAITESDVMLAAASDAVIVGFQVRPTTGARALAKQEEIDIRTYSVIYDAIEEVRDALEGMLSPEKREETVGSAEVRQTFQVPGVGTVAGCRVTEGRIHRNDRIRVVRDGVVVYEGRLGSLKHHQDDVREIQSGYEGGLSVENFDDIKIGDELETYRIEEIARTLEEV